MKNKRFSKESKIAIVYEIVSGALPIQAAMEKYDVAKKSTIVKWIKTLLPEARKQLDSGSKKDIPVGRSELENMGIRMFERIEILEKECKHHETEKLYLLERIRDLEAKLGD